MLTTPPGRGMAPSDSRLVVRWCLVLSSQASWTRGWLARDKDTQMSVKGFSGGEGAARVLGRVPEHDGSAEGQSPRRPGSVPRVKPGALRVDAVLARGFRARRAVFGPWCEMHLAPGLERGLLVVFRKDHHPEGLGVDHREGERQRSLPPPCQLP